MELEGLNALDLAQAAWRKHAQVLVQEKCDDVVLDTTIAIDRDDDGDWNVRLLYKRAHQWVEFYCDYRGDCISELAIILDQLPEWCASEACSIKRRKARQRRKEREAQV